MWARPASLIRSLATVRSRSGTSFNFSGYRYPGDLAMSWMDVFNPEQGVGYYYANQDPETRLSTLYTELHPYAERDRADNWPKATHWWST